MELRTQISTRHLNHPEPTTNPTIYLIARAEIMDTSADSEMMYSPHSTDSFWPQNTNGGVVKSELVAVRSSATGQMDLGKDNLAIFKTPMSGSPENSPVSVWSQSQHPSSSPTSFTSTNTTTTDALALTRLPFPFPNTQFGAGSSAAAGSALKLRSIKKENEEEKAITAAKDPRSFDQYTLFFMDGYSPFGLSPSPSAEQKHQISMLSSMDIFLKTRLQQNDSVCGPLAVERNMDGVLTIFEAPFHKFWAVFYLLEAGRMTEAFSALDDWCDYIREMLKSQQPPLVSLMSMMYDEFRQVGRPEIAEKVLNYLTGLAEVYFGKRHPMSIMLWCLRASNISDETALPELALERAVEQLGRIKHEHINLLIEDFKLRWVNVLRHRNKIEEAVVVLRDMVSTAEEMYGPSSPKTAEPLYVIARTYFAAENDLPAVIAFQEVLQRVGDIPGDDQSWLRACSNGRLAQIYKRLGYDVQARTHALTLLSEAGKIWDKDHPQRKVWLARLEKENIL